MRGLPTVSCDTHTKEVAGECSHGAVGYLPGLARTLTGRKREAFLVSLRTLKLSDVDHGAFARHAIYLHGLLSFTQELNMRNQTYELSIDDLDEVSGGILFFPGPLPGPIVPGGHHHHHHPGRPVPVYPDPIPFPGIQLPPGIVFN